MMSKKQWFGLLCVFVAYLLMGAALFNHLEFAKEREHANESLIELNRINTILQDNCCKAGKTKCANLRELHRELREYCQRPFGNVTMHDVKFKWNFYNSFLFVITVVSTIGYGNLAPTFALSRILMIFYALIGIPFNGILLANLGDYFGSVFIRVHQRYKKEQLETRAGLVTDILLYLIPGFLVFIFLPSGLFAYFEGWDFDVSVYYAFVTLTTIGFGDFVAAQDSTEFNNWFVAYQVFLVVWIVFGLGYMVMIVGFITRALRSKRVARLEHKLVHNLKHTQSKLWNTFTKDIHYLRRLLNEVYIYKLKPVYREKKKFCESHPHLKRSKSAPALLDWSIEDDGWITPPCRRRANSEAAIKVLASSSALSRVLSESDLGRIDREATFAAASAIIKPVALLAQVMAATESVQNATGVQCFSDEEILASERDCLAQLSPAPKPHRNRACSAVQISNYKFLETEPINTVEWTWSGGIPESKKLQQLIKRPAKKRQEFGSLDAGKNRPPPYIKQWASKLLRGNKTNSIGNLSEEEKPVDTFNNYLTYTGNSLTRNNSQSPERSNSTNDIDMNSLLEETSIADLIRKLKSLESQVALLVPANSPKRKMGTASLTPPKLLPLMTLFPPNPQCDYSPNLSQGIAPRRRFSLRPVKENLRRSSLKPTVQEATNSMRQPNNPRNNLRRFSMWPTGSNNQPSLFSRLFQHRSSLATSDLSYLNPPPVPPPMPGNPLRTRFQKREKYQST